MDGGQGGGSAGGGQGGGQGAPFATPADARTFLNDFADPDVLKGVADDKVVGWASRVKTKIDSFGTQFPQNWRQQIAGENAEHLKTLERFQSPKAMYESYAALRTKMASGELKQQTPFPDKGTDEQKLAWRKDNGLPEKAEGYEVKLPQGVVLGDEQMAGIEAFKKFAFDNNLPPSAVNAAVMYDIQRQSAEAEQRADSDKAFRAEAEDALRAEWGQGYRENLGRLGAILGSAPEGVKAKISSARTADGQALGDDPDIIRWLVGVHREINPAGVILPGQGGNLAKSIDDEIGDIEKLMREDRMAYNKDEKKQARLRDLYAARDKMGAKKAA